MRSRRSLRQLPELKYCSSPLLVDGGVEGVPSLPDDDIFYSSCLGPLCVVSEDYVEFSEGDAFVAAINPSVPCTSVSFDTFARQPCSSPPLAPSDLLLPPGVLGTPLTGTCGVESSFRAGTAADAPTSACLLLQVMVPVQVTLPVSPAPSEPLADLANPCPSAAGAVLDNVPCMPITNENENTNENSNTLTNDNSNLAENNNSQTVVNVATGGVSGDSASTSASNPNTAVSNPISINVGSSSIGDAGR
jgi:hypothetical protein